MLERMNKRKRETNEGRRMIQRKRERQKYTEIKNNIEGRKKRRKKSGMNEEKERKKMKE